MKNRWSDAEARQYCDRYAPRWGEALALRVYTSRLIGAEADLVMHGGGNTSVKTARENLLGDRIDALCVKGSGWDLDSIEPEGFPALDLAWLRKLRKLEALSDEEMVNQLRTHLFDASAPNPSVETLLHAFLPHAFIDHTHADAILALTNQPDGTELIRNALGDRVLVVPYVMPGFRLAKLAAEIFEAKPDAEGMVLLKHGLFTFAADARTSYERTVDCVDRAESFLRSRLRGRSASSSRATEPNAASAKMAQIGPALRGLLASPSGNPDQPHRRVILEHRATPEILGLLGAPQCASLAARGPLTPDHVIRTKAHHLFIGEPALQDADALRRQLADAIAIFRTQYDACFAEQVRSKGVTRSKLDPDPRVLLIPGVGIISAGKTRKDAAIAADIAEHTLRIKASAEAIGRYEPLDDSDLFDMEYWSLEQAELGKEPEKPLARQVALVTGAAGAIGLAACVELAKAGAHVVLTDIDPEALERARGKVAQAAGGSSCESVRMDVTDEESVGAAFDHACRAIGPDRARSRGIPPEKLQEFYRERNLLHAEITGAHVARAVVFFASNQTPTTGATLPVDGGIAAAFPR